MGEVVIGGCLGDHRVAELQIVGDRRKTTSKTLALGGR